ncbi:MAG TPA: hypothetical protein VLQ45_05445 [Thermoanaerobaculia bacterium]|nr:hypothetical protein [Thermoanaerobaculia bacterium]
MITGYNTDVRHGEVVFHVQTEDKGTANPYIESLVYVGGQVLVSKRASYAELLAEGKDEKDIVALMDHQHRTMIAAVRHGKLDAKLASLSSGKQTGQFPAVETPVSRPVPVQQPPPTAPVATPLPAPGRLDSGPMDSGATVARPAPPPARPTPMPERTLDQVILEYLTNEADQEQLVLLLNEDANLSLGQRAELVLRTSSSKTGNPISGAQISIRMISTVAEPRVLAVGRTDDQGLLPLSFDIPQVGRGTSALIITAASAIGRAELKHLL